MATGSIWRSSQTGVSNRPRMTHQFEGLAVAAFGGGSIVTSTWLPFQRLQPLQSMCAFSVASGTTVGFVFRFWFRERFHLGNDRVTFIREDEVLTGFLCRDLLRAFSRI